MSSDNWRFSTVCSVGLTHKVERLYASCRDKYYTRLLNSTNQWQVKTYKVTHWLKEQDQILLGPKENLRNVVHTFWIPGHTPDHLILHYPIDNRLFLGDIFYRFADINFTGTMSSSSSSSSSSSVVLGYALYWFKSNQVSAIADNDPNILEAKKLCNDLEKKRVTMASLGLPDPTEKEAERDKEKERKKEAAETKKAEDKWRRVCKRLKFVPNERNKDEDAPAAKKKRPAEVHKAAVEAATALLSSQQDASSSPSVVAASSAVTEPENEAEAPPAPKKKPTQAQLLAVAAAKKALRKAEKKVVGKEESFWEMKEELERAKDELERARIRNRDVRVDAGVEWEEEEDEEEEEEEDD